MQLRLFHTVQGSEKKTENTIKIIRNAELMPLMTNYILHNILIIIKSQLTNKLLQYIKITLHIISQQ